MKTLYPFLLILLLFACKAEAQKIMSCDILQVILKENDFKRNANNTQSVHEYDTSGNVFTSIYKQQGDSKRISLNNKIILIDTFGFFNPQCSGLYGSTSVEVRNSIPKLSEQKRELKKLVWVSGIGTGKENAFCFAIVQQSSNVVHVYYMSIFGHEIKLIKKKGGVF